MAVALAQFQTPFYVFDINEAVAQVQKIREKTGDKTHICYAMKANPFIAKELEAYIDCLEVCSWGEFCICESKKIDMQKVVLSGVHKEEGNLDYAIKTYGSAPLYTAESVRQWEMLARCAQRYAVNIRVLLRLSSGNQFGMGVQDVFRIAEKAGETPYVTIAGIHYFSGTQKKSSNRFAGELSMLADFFGKLEGEYGLSNLRLEYGPGLPADYFEQDKPAEENMLCALSSALAGQVFPGGVTLELGRFIAASCGCYVSSVKDVKNTEGNNYCILDGGIHHVNYYGQVLAMKSPPVQHWEENSEEAISWSVCGLLCTANDVLLKQFLFRGLKIGDRLIFHKTGAYAVTEGISLFLSHPLPKVVLFDTGQSFKTVREHTPTHTLNT